MQTLYSGSNGSVDVPTLGLFGVEPDEPVEVDDQASAQLLAQGWTLAQNRDENNDDENDKGE